MSHTEDAQVNCKVTFAAQRERERDVLRLVLCWSEEKGAE